MLAVSICTCSYTLITYIQLHCKIRLLQISQHRRLQDRDEGYISNENAFQGNRKLTENFRTLDQKSSLEKRKKVDKPKGNGKKGLEEGYKFDKPTVCVLIYILRNQIISSYLITNVIQSRRLNWILSGFIIERLLVLCT